MLFLRKKVNDMYYVIFGLPVAFVFAALQVVLNLKSERKIIRLIPLFITLGIIALLGLLMLDPVSGALAQYIDWGVLALMVYLTVGAVGSVIGTGAGWIICWVIKKSA